MGATDTAVGEPRVFGGRARLGLIVPTTNTVNEAEWQQLATPAITFHTMRMPLHAADTGEATVPGPLRSALAALVDAEPSSIAYGCMAGSMVTPVETLPHAMAEVSGVPCTSTAEAIVQALRRLGARRIAVASPYHEALNDQWRAFLEACDFEVTAVRGLGIGAGGAAEFKRIARLPLAEVRRHAEATFAAAPAEALLLSCTDLPTLPLLAPLEAALGVPVVSSNSATLWRALALAGVEADLAGAGSLLQRRDAAG